MIFLVDGSWSIGHSHFQQVKDFLVSVIEPFEIGPNKVQVGGYQPPALPPGIPTSPTSTQGRPNSEKWEVWEEAQSLWGNRRTALPIGVTCCQQADALPGGAGGGPLRGWGNVLGLSMCKRVPSLGSWEAVCGTDDSAPSTCPPPGLTQYSGDPQTEWDLNAFRTKEVVLAAVYSLRYKGGNTFTGVPGPPVPAPLGSVQVSVLKPQLHPVGQPPSLENSCVSQASAMWVLSVIHTFMKSTSPLNVFDRDRAFRQAVLLEVSGSSNG